MRYNIFRKGLIIAVFILFIGIAFAPITIGEEKNICKLESIGRIDWWDEDWEYRKKIIINHYMVAGDLQDFPVLIHNISSDFADYAQVDGDDFVFISEDQNDKYSHEIEYYDSSDGELIAWVNIPYLDRDTDTILYLYYGNPYCSNQEDPNDVWDSDYIHVWHLGDSLEDSAGSDDGTNSGTDVVSGKVSKARDFEKSESDYISFGDMAQPADGSLITITFEAWVKPESFSDECFIMNKYNTQGPDLTAYYISFNKDREFRNSVHSASGVTRSYTIDGYAEIDEWIYVTSVFDLGGTNDIKPFINGEEVSDTQPESDANYIQDISVTDELGRFRAETGTKYTDAVIDEVRWSKTARSDEWINTSFNNMNDAFGFLNIESQEDNDQNDPPYTPSNPNPENDETEVDLDADISWTCTDPEGDDITYNVFFEAEDPSPDEMVSENQTQSSYDPGTMEYETTYYWQIVAYDSYGASTNGPIWSFTTEVNNPPDKPSNPIPVNGETDVALDADISWTCSDPDGDAILYDVYFGTTVPPPLVSNDQIEKTYDPGNLQVCTIYYWQIVAKDVYGATTTGSIWNFKTRCTGAPSIPDINGPYTGKPGITYTYTFVSFDPDGDDVFYQIDWGDGTFEDWVGPYDSNEIITKGHIWDEKGNYTIKARAKDEFDAVGEWGSFDVSIPRIRGAFYYLLYWFLERFPMLEKLLNQIIYQTL